MKLSITLFSLDYTNFISLHFIENWMYKGSVNTPISKLPTTKSKQFSWSRVWKLSECYEKQRLPTGLIINLSEWVEERTTEKQSKPIWVCIMKCMVTRYKSQGSLYCHGHILSALFKFCAAYDQAIDHPSTGVGQNQGRNTERIPS
jgi:hypothetical protein